MKKELLLSMLILLTAASALAEASRISCVEQRFTHPENWPTTNITLNKDEKTLMIESTTSDSSFMTRNGDKKIKKLEISNIECDAPSITRGIFWCKFINYKKNVLQNSHANIEYFNGDKRSEIVGGNLQGVEISKTSTGLDGELVLRKHKELNLRITSNSEQHILRHFILKGVFGTIPVCTEQ